jgi:hypothetical protein
MAYIGTKPADKPLTSADITDSIITSAKIVDATITNSDVASSIITGQTAETSIAGGDSILIYDDSATALRKMTKTNLFSGVDNTPAFFVKLSSAFSVANNSTTKIQYTTELFDTNSAFDNSTNYRFTVPSGQGGKYFFFYCVRADGWVANRFVTLISINNATNMGVSEVNSPNASSPTANNSIVLNLTAGDFVEHFIYHNQGTTVNLQGSATESVTYFGGYKLIGV